MNITKYTIGASVYVDPRLQATDPMTVKREVIEQIAHRLASEIVNNKIKIDQDHESFSNKLIFRARVFCFTQEELNSVLVKVYQDGAESKRWGK